jgi:O-antigen ligase
MVAALLLVCLWPGELTAPLRRDAAICEADGINVRQRYIQWQAFINLLEGRSIAGTGAGCVNEHRSAFYYRLPKLNTLAPFDENGYLATAAEGGILALACLGWVIVNHFSMAWGRIVRARRCNDPEESRLSIAASAAVVGACAANVFSSVQYNGILVIFVAVLALTPAAGSGTGAVQRD